MRPSKPSFDRLWMSSSHLTTGHPESGYWWRSVYADIPVGHQQCRQAIVKVGFRAVGSKSLNSALGRERTFNVRALTGQYPRAGLVKMYRTPPDRAWRTAVGAPLERMVCVCRHSRRCPVYATFLRATIRPTPGEDLHREHAATATEDTNR